MTSSSSRACAESARTALAVLSLLGLLAVSPPTSADTPVGGVISASTTWTLAGSPYLVTSDVRIEGPAGLTPVLTIEPGVVVKLGAGRWIMAGGNGKPGTLIAVGTPAAPVRFTSSGTVARASWGAIYLEAQGGASRLENVVVEGAGGGSNGAIRITGSAPVLRSVTVLTSYHIGINVRPGAAPEVEGCTVSGTGSGDGVGLWVASGGRLTVGQTTLSGNLGAGICVEPNASLSGLTGIVMTGNGLDGVRHRGGAVAVSETWKSFGYPWVPESDVRIEGTGGTTPVLTIEPGAVVKMGAGRFIMAGGSGRTGTLMAVGTPAAPVRFTSTGAVARASWGAIYLEGQGGASRLENVVVEGAGGGSNGAIRITGSAPVLQNVTVQTTHHIGISVRAGAAPQIADCAVTGTGGGDGVGLWVASGGRPTLSRVTLSGSAGAGICVEPDVALLGLAGIVMAGNGLDGVRHRGGAVAVSETWKSFGYPWVPESDVRIEGTSGVTPVLTIEPGVVVKMSGSRFIMAGGSGRPGTLTAVGTAAAPVRFTSSGAVARASWGAIYLEAQGGASRLENVVVEGAGGGSNGAIRITGSAPVLRNVTVLTTHHVGLNVREGAAPEITDCTVTGTGNGDGAGLWLAAGARPVVTGALITGNAGPGIVNESTGATFRFCTVSANGGGNGPGLRNKAGQIAIRDSSIVGQTVPVRNNESPAATLVDARYNWWGSDSGAAGLLGGVETEPWLGAAPSPALSTVWMSQSTEALTPAGGKVSWSFRLPAPASWTFQLVHPQNGVMMEESGHGELDTVTWDGTDGSGTPYADGTYTVWLRATDGTRTGAPLLRDVEVRAQEPVAIVELPQERERVAVGQRVAIHGTTDQSLPWWGYELDYGEGELPTVWTRVDRGSRPVSGGLLGTLTTALLPPGLYTVRLTANGARSQATFELVDEEVCP